MNISHKESSPINIMNSQEEQKDGEGEQQENVVYDLKTDVGQDVNIFSIKDGSQKLSSNLTKPNGEKDEIGPAVAGGADKQQNLIEVPDIKGTPTKEHEEIVKYHDEICEKKRSVHGGGNIEHNQQSHMDKAITILPEEPMQKNRD